MYALHFFRTDSIRKLFTDIKYSEKGMNDREHEEMAYMYFIDYLDDCEKGCSSLLPVMA